jgi:hypothetical protein
MGDQRGQHGRGGLANPWLVLSGTAPRSPALTNLDDSTGRIGSQVTLTHI